MDTPIKNDCEQSSGMEYSQLQPIEPELIENLKDIPPQHEAYLMLRAEGINKTKAAGMVGYDRSYGQHLENKFNKYLISGNTKVLKLANKNLVNMLQPTAPTKDSSRVALINMVYDRHDPVVRQNVNLNISCDISPVDLSKYRNR